MKYSAPDGHIIESSSSPVVYTCENHGVAVGVYDSLETQASNNAYGIQQIKINRVITESEIVITVTESTEQELQDYLNTIIPPITIDNLLNG